MQSRGCLAKQSAANTARDSTHQLLMPLPNDIAEKIKQSNTGRHNIATPATPTETPTKIDEPTHQLFDANTQRHCRKDEAEQWHPQVSQHAVQELASSLDGGLEGDASTKFTSQCTPGSLDIGEPQNHIGDVGKPQRLWMPPLHRCKQCRGLS